jgi:chromate transporter
VCALIVQSVITLAKKSVVDVTTILLFCASIALTLFVGLSPIWVVALGIGAGLGIGVLKGRRS